MALLLLEKCSTLVLYPFILVFLRQGQSLHGLDDLEQMTPLSLTWETQYPSAGFTGVHHRTWIYKCEPPQLVLVCGFTDVHYHTWIYSCAPPHLVLVCGLKPESSL